MDEMKEWTRLAEARMQVTEDKLTMDMGKVNQGIRDMNHRIDGMGGQGASGYGGNWEGSRDSGRTGWDRRPIMETKVM